ncbi:hypothetical protein RJ641_025661 [Dillenia turbinata]|uniref:Uncharacterized protein n=1 Tax=Dillenia turbinata TaxID=194707 RepID=A0AAN8W1Z7_9MAGN
MEANLWQNQRRANSPFHFHIPIPPSPFPFLPTPRAFSFPRKTLLLTRHFPSLLQCRLEDSSRMPSNHSHSQDHPQSSFFFGVDGNLNGKLFTLVTSQSHKLTHAKATGYFLLLVPLIAFCIRCIIGAFQIRVAGGSKHKTLTDVHLPEVTSSRWKSALIDIREPEKAHPRPDLSNFREDQAQIHYEEMAHAYSKLEQDYKKFLSECGMSKSGYWRGGVSSN